MNTAARRDEVATALESEGDAGGSVVRVAKIDAIKNVGLARRFYVEYYPMLILLTDGRVYKVSRDLPRTVERLVSYARGEYLDTVAEWAVLSWMIFLPVHVFVDSIDEVADGLLERYREEIQTAKQFCTASGGAAAVCGSMGVALLIITCVMGTCLTSLCCDPPEDDDDDGTAPRSRRQLGRSRQATTQVLRDVQTTGNDNSRAGRRSDRTKSAALDKATETSRPCSLAGVIRRRPQPVKHSKTMAE